MKFKEVVLGRSDVTSYVVISLIVLSTNVFKKCSIEVQYLCNISYIKKTRLKKPNNEPRKYYYGYKKTTFLSTLYMIMAELVTWKKPIFPSCISSIPFSLAMLNVNRLLLQCLGKCLLGNSRMEHIWEMSIF